MEGFVYVAYNTRYLDEVKIGMTKYPIEKRMKDLTRHSGTLGRFVCYYHVKVINPFYVESLVHALFKEYRIQDDREFFAITLEKAKLALRLIESYNLQDIEFEEDDDEDEVNIAAK